jgi:hypothetical protein
MNRELLISVDINIGSSIELMQQNPLTFMEKLPCAIFKN